MIVNFKDKDELENLDLLWLKWRLVWEGKGIKFWEFVLSVFGV